MKSIDDIFLSEITKGKSYWSSQRPIEDELMYFLLVDRFHDGKSRYTVSSTKGFGDTDQLKNRCGGTIRGIIKQLEYISEMGFTSIWINPFFQNNIETYHGYGIENFLDVDTEWGTKQDIIELVEKAHMLNMRIFFDVVLNHTGNNWSYRKHDPVYNKGFQYATKSWRYTDKPIPTELRNFNCYNRKGRIRRWEETPETWDGDIFELKDLVQDESQFGLRNLEIMIAIYSYWIALTDCDGFRIDAAKHIPPEWLEKFITAIKTYTASIQKKSFFVFVEIIGDETMLKKYQSIDGYLDFSFYFSTVKKLHKKNKGEIYLGKEGIDAFPIRFLDNHDQIGQMPKRRIGNKLSKPVLTNLLRAFLLLPGLPCIYYGTEQGLKGMGVHDGEIRECLFNPLGTEDLFDRNSTYFKTIKEFASLRFKWGVSRGIVKSCSIVHSLKNNCIALQISCLGKSKLVLYNLKSNNELVSVKLAWPIFRTNKLVVYLYSDIESIEVDVHIQNDLIYNIPIAPFGFIVLDLGTSI